MLTKSHNVLTAEDICIILYSEWCNESNAEDFRNRLIFSVGLSLGVRTAELTLFDVNQFSFENVCNRKAIVFTPRVGSLNGTSKNAKGWHKGEVFQPS